MELILKPKQALSVQILC